MPDCSYQFLLKILINKCHNCSKTWRYEFNHSESGVVTFGETKPIHCKSLKEREWALGDDTVKELYEYKNHGVLKNCCGSFASNISHNIDKTRKKASMIFSSNVDHRKTNPLIYVKFWRQACLPSLLFGAELFTITPSLLLELERGQSWFLKKLFHVPPPGALLLGLTELNSIEAEIDMRKLLFLGCLVTEPKMASLLRNLLRSRTESLFDNDVKSIGILPSICEALNKYDLFNYFEIWFNSSTFPHTATGNQLSKIKFVTWRVGCGWNFLFWSSEHACCTSLLRKHLSIQTFTRIWSVVFIPKSDSWVIYVLIVAFHGSLKLRALFVLYAKKTQKGYITTLLSVSLLGIIIILCGLT